MYINGKVKLRWKQKKKKGTLKKRKEKESKYFCFVFHSLFPEKSQEQLLVVSTRI